MSDERPAMSWASSIPAWPFSHGLLAFSGVLMSRARLASTLIGVTAAALVVGAAAPGIAGSARSKDYPAAWNFSGSVVGDATKNMTLSDYLTSEFFDRSSGTPATGEGFTVEGKACKVSTKYFDSGLNARGAATTWANAPLDTVSGGKMRLACTYDGATHFLNWGLAPGGEVAEGTENCLVLTRRASNMWTLSAGENCIAQDEIVDRRGERLSVTYRAIPFQAILTTVGSPPVQ